MHDVLTRACFLLCLVFVALPGPVRGAPDARAAVQTAYDAMSEATVLKFRGGVVFYQASDYEAFTPDGHRMAERDEDEQFENHLSEAVSVKDTRHIASFSPAGAGRVACRVEEKLEVVAPAPVTRAVRTVNIDSVSDDTWVQTPKGWRLQSSHLKSQDTHYGAAHS